MNNCKLYANPHSRNLAKNPIHRCLRDADSSGKTVPTPDRVYEHANRNLGLGTNYFLKTYPVSLTCV